MKKIKQLENIFMIIIIEVRMWKGKEFLKR